MDELIDSVTRVSPPITTNVFLYGPLVENLGSKAIAIKIMHNGMKQTIKNVEIITTILATFRFLLDTLPAWTVLDEFPRHSAFLFSLITSVAVQMMMMMKALNGTNAL